MMGLRFIAQAGTWNRETETIRIHALDGRKSVMCSVSKAALLDASGLDRATPERLGAIFERIRPSVEAAAERNYNAGLFRGTFRDVLVDSMDLGGGYGLSRA